MDERGEPKRIRLGDAVSVGDGESGRLGGGSVAVDEDEGDGIDQGPEDIHVMQGLVADSTPEVGSSAEGREMSSLDTDLLVKVMSYLPQQDRCELMLVNRHWEKTVWDGSVLWRKVKVVGMWDIRSKEGRRKGRHANMLRLLHAAEEVEFSGFTRNPSYKAIVGVLGTGLRVLRLPHLSVDTEGLQSILAKCTHLEALLKGGPLGDKTIRIYHPKLRKLEIQVRKFDRRLKVDCPSLTHLSTTGNEDDRLLGYREDIKPPSLLCPLLTSPYLSSLHCASGVLESMAAQCPNIKVLHAYCTPLSPPSVMNLFKSLEVLTFKASVDTPDAALIQHQHREPKEEELSSPAACAILEVNRRHIRELRVSDCLGFVSADVTWPSLERLIIYECGYNADSHGIECLADLTSICPRLKSAVLVMAGGVEGRLELAHETLEELGLMSAPCTPKRIACPKLRKLIIRRGYGGRSELALRVEYPDLIELQICKYSDLSFLPPILLELTSLKRLQISRACVDVAVVLQHSHIQELSIEKCEMEKVRLVMQSLVQVSVLESRMLWFTLDLARKVWLDYTPMYWGGESVHKSVGGCCAHSRLVLGDIM